MNHNLSLLRNLYFAASGKYQKFRVRFDKAIQTGRFNKLSKRKQSSLISRLKKLYERLKSLQTQLRIAGTGAALALTLSVSSTVQAQSSLGPFVRNDALNPLPPPVFIPHPRPAVADIDNDGDLDVFIGNVDGYIQFFRNDSPNGSVTRFVELSGSDNPFNGINKGTQAAIAVGDVDGDLDYDLLLGTYSGDTYFFENTGSRTSPVFAEQTGSNNPFDGITGTATKYSTQQAIPAFVDFDGDLDLDLFVGSSYRYDYYTGGHPSIEYYENNAGVFTQTPDTGLGGALEFLNRVDLTFADVTNDGALDAIVGADGSSHVRCYVQGIEAQFTEVFGTWNPDTRTGNPFSNLYVFPYSSPVAADFDEDGDLDFLVGSQSYYSEASNLKYFENTDGKFSLVDLTDLNISPFGGVDVGEEAAPVFADLDGDGDLDALIGSKYSNPDFSVFINNDGQFIADPDNPLIDIIDAAIGFSIDIIPVFVDIDDDGDQDLFVSIGYQAIFFENDDGTFEYTTSPLDLTNANEASLAFLDVDNDNDFDVLIGNESYGEPSILYYENTGTASTPDFVETTPPVPFDNPFFERYANVLAVDLDNDGDTDIVVSETYYNGWYGDEDAARSWFFENKGDGTFIEPEEAFLIENTPRTFNSFADIDGDGDLDSFIGNGESFDYAQNGKVFFLENTNPAPLTETEMSELIVIGGSPIVIAPNLTITDEDNDDIILATVTISDFVSGGEVLGFTPQAGITGTFDDGLGVLTFTGKASIEAYETLLRSVTINFTGNVPGARKSKAASVLNLLQNITFQVRDTDFTLTTVAVVSRNILPGNELTIYNAVSPNKGDEMNSFLRIAAIETISPENTVTIYNRWGDVVFEVKNYNNSESSKRFEGVNKNGKDLPSGTYFYKIEITGKTVTGYLSLKR